MSSLSSCLQKHPAAVCTLPCAFPIAHSSHTCTGPTQGATSDVSPDPAPPAAPTPLELDPRTSPEPAEPTLKKRKIPRLAAPSDLRGGVGSGSPSVDAVADADADAVGNRAQQPSSSGELPWSLKHSSALTTLQQNHLFPPCDYNSLYWHHCSLLHSRSAPNSQLAVLLSTSWLLQSGL